MRSILPEGVSLSHPTSLFIGGEWLAPENGATVEVVSPHTEQVCAVSAIAGEQDMDKAVAAARRAFDAGPWPKLSVAERAAVLHKMSDILQQRESELSIALTAQNGALASFAPWASKLGTATLAKYADIGVAFEWERRQPSSTPGYDAVVLRQPVGVVAAISPWNMPYTIMIQKIAPALIAGCTVIMKPAPETPLETYIIAEAAEAAGLPPGVLNLVPSMRDAADYLVRNSGVDKISFTGSTLAGRRIASVAAERIARVTLELGGKSPAIVLDDFPIQEAAKILTRTIIMLSGQVCATLSRVIVTQSRHDELADAIVTEMKKVKVGDPFDPDTEMGPIAMRRQLKRVEHYVDTGIREDAKLMCGGKRLLTKGPGFYYEPTLFSNVDNRMTIAREEIFGPVLSLIPARDLEHAISLANESDYGLNAAVLSKKQENVYQVGKQLRTGTVAQNGLKVDFNLPHGGFKQSGIGREGGTEGIMSYVETQTMMLERESDDS